MNNHSLNLLITIFHRAWWVVHHSVDHLVASVVPSHEVRNNHVTLFTSYAQRVLGRGRPPLRGGYGYEGDFGGMSRTMWSQSECWRMSFPRSRTSRFPWPRWSLRCTTWRWSNDGRSNGSHGPTNGSSYGWYVVCFVSASSGCCQAAAEQFFLRVHARKDLITDHV